MTTFGLIGFSNFYLQKWTAFNRAKLRRNKSNEKLGVQRFAASDEALIETRD